MSILKGVNEVTDTVWKAAAYSYRCARRRYHQRVAAVQRLVLLACMALLLGK